VKQVSGSKCKYCTRGLCFRCDKDGLCFWAAGRRLKKQGIGHLASGPQGGGELGTGDGPASGLWAVGRRPSDARGAGSDPAEQQKPLR
jgi:hypothetical protein